MPNNPTPPYWIRTTPTLSATVTEPPVDLEASEPNEPAGASRWSSHPSLLLFLGVFLVATVCVNLWPDEGHVASSTEAGIDAEGVVASLVAERREHAALVTVTRERESGATDSPANGETRPQTPGGKTGSNEETGEAATTKPSEPVGEAPAKGNLTLPVIGETPLPEREIPDPLPALAGVPPVPGTLLP